MACPRAKTTAGTKILWIVTLLFAFTICSAWVPPNSAKNAHARVEAGVARKLPALGMFDWLKPKPDSKSTDAKEPEAASKPNDFLTSFFNQAAPPKERESRKVEKEQTDTTDSAASTPSPSTSDSTGKVFAGTVKSFNPRKGFGFISSPEVKGSDDIFVHQTAIQVSGFRSLTRGEAVEFQLGTDKSGRQKAVNITGPNGEDLKVLRRERDQENK